MVKQKQIVKNCQKSLSLSNKKIYWSESQQTLLKSSLKKSRRDKKEINSNIAKVSKKKKNRQKHSFISPRVGKFNKTYEQN